MIYQKLGKTELEVSRIGFGVLTVGKHQLNLSVQESGELIAYAYSLGMNFFDTAQYYDTYKHLRKGLEIIKERKLLCDGKPRKPIIVSKCLDADYESMQFAIHQALEALDLTRIDVFLLHEIRSEADFDARSGAWNAMLDAKKSGLIRYMGVSTHHINVAQYMCEIPECDVVFPLINKFGLGIRKNDTFGSAEEMAEAINKLSQCGKGVFSMKAFGGGNLTGTYTECLDYVNSLEGNDSIMIGFGKTSEVDDAVNYIEGKLPKDFAPNIKHKKIHINESDCEGCGSCVLRCPNHAIFYNKSGLAEVNHNICLTCGYCAPVCPVRAIIMY